MPSDGRGVPGALAEGITPRVVRGVGPGSVSDMVAAVLYVKSLGLMTAFYEKCLGMSVAESAEGDFSVLAGDGWELTLVAVPPAVAAAIVVNDPPARRAATPVKLVFEVAGIEGLRPVVAETGGQIDPAGTAREFRGFRLVDAIDPEGNVVQLRERVAGH
jgi:predicted enzyme related to lactoylglutathione lyase